MEAKKGKPAKKKESAVKEVVSRTKNASDAYLDGMSFKRRYEESDKKDREDIVQAIDRFNNAITQLTTSTGQERHNKTQAMYFAARGDCFMLLKEFQKAHYDFVIAIKYDGEESTYYQSRGNCELQLGHVKDALNDFQLAIKYKDNDGFNYLNRALVYGRLQEFRLAIKDYTEAISRIKDNTGLYKAFLHRGNCYRYEKEYERAIEDLLRACELTKNDPDAQNSLGMAFFDNQQYDLALERFSKAIELNDQNAKYYNNKGLALYHLKEYHLSLEECNRALKLDPQDARIYYNRGNNYLALGRTQESHEDFDRSIALDDKNPKFYHSKGLAYQEHDFEKAILYFQKALQVDPSNVPSLYHLGLMQHKNGMLSEALESLTQVLQELGEERLVLESRGLVYQDNKTHSKAVQDFTRAIELEPFYAEVYYYRGLSKIEMARLGEGHSYEEAIADLKKASELGSRNPGIYSGIGQAYRLLGDHEKALYYLNEALRSQPHNIEFLIQRSNVFVDVREFKSAIDDLSLALSKKPEDPQILYQRGLAFFKNDEFKKCIKDLYEALAHKPYPTYEADIHYHLGIAYAYLELHDKAIEPLSQAILLSPNQPCYYHERAKALLRIGQHERSVEDFLTVLAMQPRNAHAYFGRAFAYKALRRYDEAAADFQKAKELDPFNPRLIINQKKIYDIPYIRLCKPGEQMKERQDNLAR